MAEPEPALAGAELSLYAEPGSPVQISRVELGNDAGALKGLQQVAAGGLLVDEHQYLVIAELLSQPYRR